MAIELKAATDADRTFARDLTRRAMLPYYREFDLLWIEEAFDQAWAWREQWLVVEGDTVLGFCSLSQDRQALFIRELHLSPEHRGRGVGSCVLEQLADWASLRHLPLLRLMVFRSNPARYLYLRHGFLKVGEADCFWQLQREID
ncbi:MULTISPECIES: GNAT family N-acetyltransferase [Pseudomonas]|uniref:GNAT family N-acetyltransferase n=1 Tax=Pseudomonas taiwanensis TaxID=470150 RepID=A0ABR6V103_9PSED|nr:MULTISPECIES: GNAT family N-acetyltransferase [Pseudomonas]AGZ35890.1 N-acetyltransferase GCN5 [Pseudomonas sp. VLB120]AVD89551.1 N-acetyltransferase [Pseudomonas sp. SWI44]MBC3474156.1 GNAT family N-acetyltransferase [Pseudomonas taiwanensis]MBC3492309.1 GNAT family N-acetyltransferase [Pseudomonas taiwanensis]MDT8924068.1 GNAT family N-acetyltransferase [Pseudomonas taiwanensis]